MTLNNCEGYCKKCDQTHSLGVGNSQFYALKLFRELEAEQRIDFEVSQSESNTLYSTDCLFGQYRGQMFGVLECVGKDGQKIILKAYSGQHNGVWCCDGWMQPLFDYSTYSEIWKPGEIKIKLFTKEILELKVSDPLRVELKKQRRKFSQQLMQKLFDLYYLTNFRGQKQTLKETFYYKKGIPAATADCCAPKLLNYAACHDLKPLGISEFYFGKTNKSETRNHGEFYSSCQIRCEPILGFMLCGLDT